MPRTLILATTTTAATAAQEIAAGERPRIDYLDLQARLDADVIDFSTYDSAPYRFLKWSDRLSRLAWGQAFHAMRHWLDYDVVYSLSEDVGVPLAILLRLRGLTPRHIMVAHNILSPRKVPLFRLSGVMNLFDCIVVLSSAAALGVAAAYEINPEKVAFRMDAIDEMYWRTRPGIQPEPGFVLSVGQARRDYPTLVEAVRGLPLRLCIQAGSQWSMAYHDDVGSKALPENVEIGGYLSYCDLRALYERAAFVVVPLQRGAHHSAGSVSIKEAMAMGKAVIVASGGGIDDYMRPGETGIIVPAGDALSLRKAIETLLADPAQALAMGRNGQAYLASRMTYEAKIDWLAAMAAGGPAAA